MPYTTKISSEWKEPLVQNEKGASFFGSIRLIEQLTWQFCRYRKAQKYKCPYMHTDYRNDYTFIYKCLCTGIDEIIALDKEIVFFLQIFIYKMF